MADSKYDYDALLRELREEAEATFPGWKSLTSQPLVASAEDRDYGFTPLDGD